MKKIIYILLLGISLNQYAPDFDGQKAYEFLLKQCSFGPRYPGSSGHVDFKDYLIKYLNKYSDNIKVMEHDYKHPYENKIDLKLTLGYDKSQTDYASSTSGSFETTAFSNSFNIKPEITYSFSKYIDGNFYVNYSVSETHTTGSKETTDIGFKVKIVFESFK